MFSIRQWRDRWNQKVEQSTVNIENHVLSGSENSKFRLFAADSERWRATSGEEGKRYEFTNVIFQDCERPFLKVGDAKFSNCIFKHCDFTGAEFDRCEFGNCAFEMCKLLGISFTSSKLKQTTFKESELSGSDFSGTKFGDHIEGQLFDAVVFSKCKLEEADFSVSSHEATLFEQCDMTNLSFKDGALKFTTFEGCSMKGVCMSGAQMLSPSFENTPLRGVDLTGAIITESFASPMDTVGWDIDNADAARAEFHTPLLEGVGISNSVMDMTGAPEDFTIRKCAISDCSFFGSSMLKNALIEDTRFMGRIDGSPDDLGAIGNREIETEEDEEIVSMER